jgi:hypothetical protein
MISIKDFGWRLGNQLFQIAAATALAVKNDDEVAYPEWSYAKYFKGDFTPKTSKIEHVHELRFYNSVKDGVVISVPDISYQEIIYKSNLAISGYFQSEKYFANCKKKIRNMFEMNMDPSLCEEAGFRPECRQIAIHVRRGDYIKYPNHHPMIGIDYYHAGIAKILEDGLNHQLIIFSDDIPWCKEAFKDYDCIYPENNDIESFYLMTQCHDFVIGNSSFSWWGAYLGKWKDKKVICPKTWFGPAYAHFNTEDLYCDGWVRL